MIEQWFSVPILYEDNLEEKEKIQEEIQSALAEIRKNNLENPWQDNVLTTFKFGNSTNDILTYKLDTLKKSIITLGKEYLKNWSRNTNLQVYNSWFNFYTNGMFQYDHNHSSVICALSGVYYFRTNEKDGDIVFINPNIYLADEISNIGISTVSYSPKEGRLLLFPCWLRHKVKPNNTKEERISISFNLIYGSMAQLEEQ
jgi:uncharacterized protein (TIGR02466 family)